MSKFIGTAVLLLLTAIAFPLEILSQIAPDVSYQQWCTRLDELHRALRPTPSNPAAPIIWSMCLLSGTLLVFSGTDIGFTIVGTGLAIIGGMGLLSLLLPPPRIAFHQQQLKEQINFLMDAGEARGWHYPCGPQQ
jgi:hypothetical protein